MTYEGNGRGRHRVIHPVLFLLFRGQRRLKRPEQVDDMTSSPVYTDRAPGGAYVDEALQAYVN